MRNAYIHTKAASGDRLFDTSHIHGYFTKLHEYIQTHYEFRLSSLRIIPSATITYIHQIVSDKRITYILAQYNSRLSSLRIIPLGTYMHTSEIAVCKANGFREENVEDQ